MVIYCKVLKVVQNFLWHRYELCALVWHNTNEGSSVRYAGNVLFSNFTTVTQMVLVYFA